MKEAKLHRKRTKLLALILSFILIFTQHATAFAAEMDEEQTGTAVELVAQILEDENINPSDTDFAAEMDEEQTGTAVELVAQILEDENINPSDTEKSILTLSEYNVLTEDVITNVLNGVIDSGTIALDRFYFTTDKAYPPESDAIKEQAAGDVTAVTSGAVDSLFKDEITVDGTNYVFDRITVDGVDVYYIGTIKIQSDTYIYYITDKEITNTTVYMVLNGNDKKFTVSYSRADRYEIEYVIQDGDGNEADSISNYDLDDVFGADRITYLDVTESGSENDSYTVNVNIPRGYKATVNIYDASGNSVINPLKLGEMMEYSSETSGGTVVPAEGSPDSVQISGTITIEKVSSNQKVVLQYEEYQKFTFSAATWLTTDNAGGTVSSGQSNRLESISITVDNVEKNVSESEDAVVTFTPGETVTWTFTGRTLETGAYTWLLNYLQINGEYLNVPLLGEHAEDEVRAETVLSTGTVVTIAAKNDDSDVSWGNKDKTTTYTVTITNCYEDITISAGNMVGHGHKEFAIESLVGASDLKVYYDGRWQVMTQGNREEFGGTTDTDKLVFQFQHGAGYFLPDVTVLDINGAEIENAVVYLRLKPGASLEEIGDKELNEIFEVVPYSEIVQEADETYFFKFSEDVIKNLGSSRQLHVYIEGKLMKFEAHYDNGVGNSDTPQAGDIANLPGPDDNNGTYYNVVTDNIINVSSSIPTDTSGNYVFTGWQIVAVNGKGSSNVINDGNGEPITILAGSHLDLAATLHDWLHEGINQPSSQDVAAYFTLKATWKEAVSADVITYVVNYYLDNDLIKSNSFTANNGAMLVFNAYKDDELNFTDDLQNILKSDNSISTDYTGDGKKSIVLEKVVVNTDGEPEEHKAEDLTKGGIFINGAAGLTAGTAVNVYLKTETGNLVVSKTVSGSGADSSQEFTFTVTLDDDSITGTYDDMTFTDGVASFTLKHGESLTATGLPAGTGYTVTESNNDGYTVIVNGNNGDTATGTIPVNATETAAFNNYKSGGGGGGTTTTGSVEITKTVTGDNAPSTEPGTPTTSTEPGRPVDDIPQTGDESNVLVWVALAGFSLLGMLVILLARKRHRYRPRHTK